MISEYDSVNMKEQQKLLQHLEQVEAKAGEILTDRQEIIGLDIRRNDDRVGLRALQKANTEKTWMTLGHILIKLPSKTVEELLLKGTHYFFNIVVRLNKL